MRIILNADDFGMSDDTVAATIDCFDQGALSSATIMANMPATGQAIEYARAHTGFSFGVHLTFCGDGGGEERPCSSPGDVPALVDRRGRFLTTTAVRLKALAGRIPAAQIERETRAQIQTLVDAGVAVSHVDSHSHLHKIGAFREALARVLPAFGITRARGVQNLYLRRPAFNLTSWLGGTWERRLRERFETTDHFYMPSSALDVDWAEPLLTGPLAGTGNDATVEVGVHPGSGEGWRLNEHDDIIAFAIVARARGHRIITWNDAFSG